ncbi:unnamed protein product, partial [Brassica oleracea var. botrytis]
MLATVMSTVLTPSGTTVSRRLGSHISMVTTGQAQQRILYIYQITLQLYYATITIFVFSQTVTSTAISVEISYTTSMNTYG